MQTFKLKSLLGRTACSSNFFLITLIFLVVFFTKGHSQDETSSSPDTLIDVVNMPEFLDAVSLANERGNVEIVMASGTYEYDTSYVSWIKWGLLLGNDKITIRSKTGRRDDVVIRGKGMEGNIATIFVVGGDSITISDVTCGWVNTHAIQVKGEEDADFFRAENVRFVDTYQQMLKVSFNESTPETVSDSGVVSNCIFEYSAGIGPQWYIGGIDCHAGRNWVVQDNFFRDIVSPEDRLGEHAIHFWSGASGTVVKRNRITNCDRGIGFGLGERGHGFGMIINNMVHTTRDVGIGLENADSVLVYNNSVVSENYPFSIEYRFSGTKAIIKNNLCNAAIEQRNDGEAEVESNVDSLLSMAFIEVSTGDLHLMEDFDSRQMVVDAGVMLPEVIDDFDREKRPIGKSVDIGADEFSYRVEALELSPDSITMRVGDTVVIQPVFFPENASNQSLEWRTDDSTIALVDSAGIVVAVSEGEVEIEAISEDGDYSAKCTIIVDTPTGLGRYRFSDKSIEVYPNPWVSGDLKIKWDGVGQGEVSFYDVLGRVVYTTKTVDNEIILEQTEIDNGFYFIRVMNDDVVYKGKLIVK